MRTSETDRRAILDTEHLLADLKVRSVRGGAVTVAAQIVKMAAQFAAIVVLARLLEPSAFGLVAMTAAAVAFLELFKDLGLSAATVQRPVLTHAQVSTMFWLNVGLGFLAAALTAALEAGSAVPRNGMPARSHQSRAMSSAPHPNGRSFSGTSLTRPRRMPAIPCRCCVTWKNRRSTA